MPPHGAVLATAKWRRREEEPDGGRHGQEHVEGQEDAGGILGRGGEHDGVHPEPRAHKSLDGTTPFEAWHERKPDVSFLRTFDCIGHVKKSKPNLTKLEDRSIPMVFLGYERGSKAY